MREEWIHFWPKPWRFEESGYLDGPCVKDAKGVVMCAFFWPGHSVEETNRAERATYSLGQQMMALSSDVTKEFKEGATRAAIRALRGLEQTAIMLEKWGPECFPANDLGQKHFIRCVTDAAAEAIRDAWKAAIVEVEAFPEDEGGWIEERGRLRQAVLEIVTEVGNANREGADPAAAVVEIAKRALKSNLVAI